MRKLLYAAALLVLTTPISLAANSAGTIDHFDSRQQTVTLTNGEVFYLPLVAMAMGLTAGDGTLVNWSWVDGRREVKQMIDENHHTGA